MTTTTRRLTVPGRADPDYGEALADDTTFAELMSRAGSADFDAWEHQVHRSGCC